MVFYNSQCFPSEIRRYGGESGEGVFRPQVQHNVVRADEGQEHRQQGRTQAQEAENGRGGCEFFINLISKMQ